MGPGLTRFAVSLAVALAAAAVWLGLLELRAAGTGPRFDFVRWEAQALPGRVLFALGRPLRDDPPPDEALGRYFALTDRTTAQARRLENVVEAAIEQRITAVLRSQGLAWPLPVQLPPVDIELAASPRILVVSPRERIERLSDEPLRPGLTLEDARALEAAEERRPDRSALVVPSGGIATYPAVVALGDGYANTVQAAAHEWMHHYLALYPLGRAYFTTDDARTINETVADVAGDELARLVLERWPAPGAPAGATPTPAPGVDTAAVLRALRLEVDALLARGQVEAAERRMEEVRLELVARGVTIRRINQAYFAWYGTYAARPDSVDLLGDQVRAILRDAGSLRRFVELVRHARTRADIARLAGVAPG